MIQAIESSIYIIIFVLFYFSRNIYPGLLGPKSKLKLMIAELTQSHAIGVSLSEMEIDIHQMLVVRMGTNLIN